MYPSPVSLWEPEAFLSKVIEAFHASHLAPLATIRRWKGAAVYVVLLAADTRGVTGDLLGPVAGTGLPVNVGAQTGLDFRAGRHRLSVRSAKLDISDWWAAVLPVADAAQALAAERAVLDAYQPVLNVVSGLGSNRAGAARAAGQARCSDFDLLFGAGREGRRRRSADDDERARVLAAKVRAHLGDRADMPPLVDPTQLRRPGGRSRAA